MLGTWIESPIAGLESGIRFRVRVRVRVRFRGRGRVRVKHADYRQWWLSGMVKARPRL